MRIFDKKYEKIVTYIRTYRADYTKGLIFVFFNSIFALLIPWFLKFAIDSLNRDISYTIVIRYGLIIIILSGIHSVFLYLMRKTIIGASREIEYRLRNEYYSHIQKLPFDFFRRTRVGDLMARGTNDLEAVRMIAGPTIMYTANTVITVLFAIVFMGIIDLELMCYTIFPLIFLTVFLYFLFNYLHTHYLAVQEQFGTLSTLAQENFSGIREIKAYVQEEKETERFGESSLEYYRKNINLTKLMGLFLPAIGLVTGLATAGILWFGGLKVIGATMTIGDLAAFTGFLTMLTWPIIALSWVMNLLERGKAAWNRVYEIFALEPEGVDRRHYVEIQELEGDVRVDSLRFSFREGERDILRDVSFAASKGQRIAIVGKTGSGKTTLLNILAGFLKPPRGTVFFDGRDVRTILPDSLRSRIAYVIQDDFIFSDTIEENLLIGADGGKAPGSSRIQDVLEMACFMDDIDGFPEKLTTMVGERGVTLSGGQKQRLSIARALLSNRPLILFDDCFSSVDTKTEISIWKSFEEKLQGKTMIFATHRLGLTKDVDSIIVLDKGKAVEMGSHEELMEREGMYSSMYLQQQVYSELLNDNGEGDGKGGAQSAS